MGREGQANPQSRRHIAVATLTGTTSVTLSTGHIGQRLGALLDEQDHLSLALWAADCAERVLPRFEEERPKDDRPRRAIEAGRVWARGQMKMGEARTAAFAAHAAAREADRAEAQAAARAAGHAAATAHVATHAPHAAAYAVKAAVQAAEERHWQCRRLPEHLRAVVFPTLGDD